VTLCDAWRITANDLIGITGPDENEKSVADSRRAMLHDATTGM
jgi:hypothetical protein